MQEGGLLPCLLPGQISGPQGVPGVMELAAGRASTDPPPFGSEAWMLSDAPLPTSRGYREDEWLNQETVKCCLNGKGLPSQPLRGPLP